MTLTAAERAKKACLKHRFVQIDAPYVCTCADIEQAIKEAVEESCCRDCKHIKVDNQHGFDQNDGVLVGNTIVHSGFCTYCKYCQAETRRTVAYGAGIRERCARIAEQIGGIGHVSSAQLAAEIRKELGR